jgi:hypothetical protein
MTPEERRVLERAVQRVTEQAANANAIVDEAMDAGLERGGPSALSDQARRAGPHAAVPSETCDGVTSRTCDVATLSM